MILKYKREDEYYKGSEELNLPGISKRIKLELSDGVNSKYFKKQVLAKNLRILKLTKPALNIDSLPFVIEIKNIIKDKISSDINISVYVHRKESPEAQATSSNNIFGINTEFIIILSQHFLNELTFQEQLAIIAHEFAHFYHKHTKIPYKHLINRFVGRKSLEDKKFSYELVKWSICKEISADLFALQITKDYQSTALALIKYTSGVLGKNSQEILRGLEQDSSALKSQKKIIDALKEHPETFLRVMILKEASNFFEKKSWKVDADELGGLIDEQVKFIYPELIPGPSIYAEISFRLGLAVAISDGHADQDEVEYLQWITLYEENNISALKEVKKLNQEADQLSIKKSIKKEEAGFQIAESMIPGILKISKKHNLKDISSVIRHVLMLAKADQKIEACELEIIYSFAKEFEYSKSEIIQQIFNLD